DLDQRRVLRDRLLHRRQIDRLALDAVGRALAPHLILEPLDLALELAELGRVLARLVGRAGPARISRDRRVRAAASSSSSFWSSADNRPRSAATLDAAASRMRPLRRKMVCTASRAAGPLFGA